MSEPGFQLSCVDYLLGCNMPTAAAMSHQDDGSFSFVTCTLFFVPLASSSFSLIHVVHYTGFLTVFDHSFNILYQLID